MRGHGVVGYNTGREDGERSVSAAVWEVLLETFEKVKSHHGDGTYTPESALQLLWNEMEDRIAYGPEEV